MEKSFRSKGVGLQRKTFHSGTIKKAVYSKLLQTRLLARKLV